MLIEGDEVVVIKDETFNTIRIYGYGVIEEIIHEDYEILYIVKLDENYGGYVIETDSVVSTSDWVDYVNEREATVIRVPYEA